MTDLFSHPLNHSPHPFDVLADLLRHLYDPPLEAFSDFGLLLLALFDALVDINQCLHRLRLDLGDASCQVRHLLVQPLVQPPPVVVCLTQLLGQRVFDPLAQLVVRITDRLGRKLQLVIHSGHQVNLQLCQTRIEGR